MQSLSLLFTSPTRGASSLDAFETPSRADFGPSPLTGGGKADSAFRETLSDAVESSARTERLDQPTDKEKTTGDIEKKDSELSEGVSESSEDVAHDEAATPAVAAGGAEPTQPIAPVTGEVGAATSTDARGGAAATDTTHGPEARGGVRDGELRLNRQAQEGTSTAQLSSDAPVESAPATGSHLESAGRSVLSPEASSTTTAEAATADQAAQPADTFASVAPERQDSRASGASSESTHGASGTANSHESSAASSNDQGANSGSDGRERRDRGAGDGNSIRSDERGSSSKVQDPTDASRAAESAPRTTERSDGVFEQAIQTMKGERRGSMSQVDPAVLRAERVDAAVRADQAVQSLASPTALDDGGARITPLNAPGASLSMDAAGDRTALGTTSASLNGRDAILDSIDDDRFTRRLVRGMDALMNQRGGVMNMRLDPPELGQMRVQMVIAQGTVSAVFHAMDPTVQSLLERNLATLRTSLEGQGLHVDKLSVQSAATTNASQSSSSQDQSNQSSQDGGSHRQDADAGKEQSRGRHDGDGSSRSKWSDDGGAASAGASEFRETMRSIGSEQKPAAASDASRGEMS